MSLMALMNQGGGDASKGVLGQLGMGGLLGAGGGMGLNAMGGDMNGLLMGNMLGMGGDDPNQETQNVAALHGLDPDDMDGDGVADHLKETSNRIDDYLAKQWLLGKRKLTVSVNYGNIPLEYQYLQQYHGMPNPLSGTPLGPKFGLPGPAQAAYPTNRFDYVNGYYPQAPPENQYGPPSSYGGQSGLPYGQQSPYQQSPPSGHPQGTPSYDPYGPPQASPYGQPQGSPYGQPQGAPSPYEQPQGAPYGPPQGS